jgi:hypothetical protein
MIPRVETRLKPWAEFFSPFFGAQNKGLSPRIVADSPFGANHPKPIFAPLWTGLPNHENKHIRKQEFQIILEDGTLARF